MYHITCHVSSIISQIKRRAARNRHRYKLHSCYKTTPPRLAIVKTQVYSSATVQIWMNFSSRGQFIAVRSFPCGQHICAKTPGLKTPSQFFNQFLIDRLDFLRIDQMENYEANGIARPGLR